MGKIIKILQRVLLKCQFLEVGEIIKILETLISWLLYRKQKRYNQQRRQKKYPREKMATQQNTEKVVVLLLQMAPL